MEYLVIGAIALLVLVGLLIIIKLEKVRNRANALFLQAEKYVTEDKLQYVSENLYEYVTSTVPFIGMFIKDELFKEIIQKLYDSARNLAKDLLDNRQIRQINENKNICRARRF